MSASPQSLYGIIGYPVTYSLSPIIHNTAFEALGLDAEYQLFPLKEEELKDFFSRLKQKDCPIRGLNVTIRYKETVLAFLDSLSPYIQKTMAVNTIVITPQRKLTGFNTDGPGFLADLTKHGFKTRNKRVSILGSGGAVRAILSVLCLVPERPASIKIFNRHKERADKLLGDLKGRFDTGNIETVASIDDLDIRHADLLINATPLGMSTQDECLVDEGLLHKKLFVYDLIYTVPETKLMKLAKKKGARAVNGLGMLFYQGVLAFHHWMGEELNETIKSRIWKKLILAVEKNG